MNDQSQLLMRSIKGPVIMITIGVLFAIDRFTDYPFSKTFPVLLIVIGLLQLAGGRRHRADYYPPPQAPAPPPFTPAAPAMPQQPPAHPEGSDANNSDANNSDVNREQHS